MHISGIQRQLNIMSYRGIGVTQGYNMSYYTTLCTLSDRHMHTKSMFISVPWIIFSHGPSKGLGLLQLLLKSSALLEVIFLF